MRDEIAQVFAPPRRALGDDAVELLCSSVVSTVDAVIEISKPKHVIARIENVEAVVRYDFARDSLHDFGKIFRALPQAFHARREVAREEANARCREKGEHHSTTAFVAHDVAETCSLLSRLHLADAA